MARRIKVELISNTGEETVRTFCGKRWPLPDSRDGDKPEDDFGNNAFRLVPTVEQPPVVRTNDKMESVLGISPFQRIQRMNSIRRPRQMEFKSEARNLG